MGPSSPSPKGEQPFNFRLISVVAKWLDGLRCHLVWPYESAQDFVLDGDHSSQSPEGGGAPAPQFSVHDHCGQTAGWIKMALGTEAALARGHIVLDGEPAPLPKKGAEPLPIFGPFLLWPNSCTHQDATWYGGRPQPRGLC